MKIRMPAKKLANADVHFLSLVERGANRTPFKIQKRDQSMINFGFRTQKQDEKKQASIVAYVVMKHDRDAGYEAEMAKAGAKIDNVVEDGDVVLYRQDDTALKNDKDEVNEELIAVKLTPDFAVVLKGYDPYQMAGETSFTENLKTMGFMPGFSMAAQALTTSVNNTLTTAKDSKEAAAKVGDALDEFGDYVHSLATEIPQAAFKALDSFQAAKGEVLKLAEGLSDDEKAYAANLEGAERFKFYRATPEERAKSMGAKAKPTEKPADAVQPAVATAPAAPVAEEDKKPPFAMKEEKVEAKKEDVSKGQNGLNAESGKGEGAQNVPATSAVNNGPAGKATSEAFDARRVDGAGGEPSAVANMGVQSDGYDSKQAPRSDSPVQTNDGNGVANNGIAKEEVAKMITDGLALASKSSAEMVAKVVADAMVAVQKQIGELAASVATANANAAAALEATKKTDKALSGTVLGGDSGGDPAPAAPVQKSEFIMGTFDTAYRRDIRKADKAAPVRAQRRVMF